MMKIEFKTGNAAFEEDFEGEIGRILSNISNLVNSGRSSGKVMDYNGNCVGTWSVD